MSASSTITLLLFIGRENCRKLQEKIVAIISLLPFISLRHVCSLDNDETNVYEGSGDDN